MAFYLGLGYTVQIFVTVVDYRDDAAGASSSGSQLHGQPSKRLQQTQAEVDEVQMTLYLIEMHSEFLLTQTS